MIATKWIFLLFLIHLASSSKILVLIPWYDRSHYVIFESLIEELLERGHEVTCISNFSPENQISSNPNFTNVLIDPPYVEGNESPEDFYLRSSTSSGYFRSFLSLQQLGVAVSRHGLQSRNVQDFLHNDGNSFDLVILEQLHHESWLMFGEIFGAPVVTFDINGFSDLHNRMMGFNGPWSLMSHHLLPYSHPMSFKERFHNLALSWADYIVHNVCYLYQQNQIVQEFFPKGGKGIPSVYVLEKNVSAIFVNSHRAITNPNPTMPNIFHVGGINLRKPQEFPTDIKKFLDEATNGVIFVSLATENSPKLLKIFLNCFVKRPQRILFRSNDESVFKFPENVLMKKWMPEGKILAHKNVVLFITHGGVLSIQEGIFHGVPMLVLPRTSEEHRNAELVSRLNLGLSSLLTDLTDEKLDEQIDDLIFEEDYSKNAKKVSELFKDNLENPMEKAIYWIEYIIRHNGAYHLKYERKNLNIIQYYSFDIYGLVILLTFAVFYIYNTNISVVLQHLGIGKKKNKRKKD